MGLGRPKITLLIKLKLAAGALTRVTKCCPCQMVLILGLKESVFNFFNLGEKRKKPMTLSEVGSAA